MILDFAVVADYALVDQAGKISVLGIFQHIWVQQFPAMHPRLHLVLRLKGKRTEVGDSRDRYANLEVSYLLERMERFKGLAVLATNRKRDLDEAFMRRIRYVIDFPVPEEPQRAAIWKQVIPPKVAEHSKIDVDFLARQFPLSGGHIRSIVFNASLQSARCGEARELLMKDILVAVKREYDKMNRSLSMDQLGPYASHIEALE